MNAKHSKKKNTLLCDHLIVRTTQIGGYLFVS